MKLSHIQMAYLSIVKRELSAYMVIPVKMALKVKTETTLDGIWLKGLQ